MVVVKVSNCPIAWWGGVEAGAQGLDSEDPCHPPPSQIHHHGPSKLTPPALPPT